MAFGSSSRKSGRQATTTSSGATTEGQTAMAADTVTTSYGGFGKVSSNPGVSESADAPQPQEVTTMGETTGAAAQPQDGGHDYGDEQELDVVTLEWPDIAAMTAADAAAGPETGQQRLQREYNAEQKKAAKKAGQEANS